MHRWHYLCLSCVSEEQDSPLQLFHVPKQNLHHLLIITVQTSPKQHSLNSQYVSKRPLLMRSAGFILSTYMYSYIFSTQPWCKDFFDSHSANPNCSRWHHFPLTPLRPLRQTNKQTIKPLVCDTPISGREVERGPSSEVKERQMAEGKAFALSFWYSVELLTF